MDYFKNTRFSYYNFSIDEMENMYDENMERLSLPNIQYIVYADGCTHEEADVEMKNLYELLKKFKTNPYYIFINIKFIYIKNNIGSNEFYNPMLIVDKDTWMFIKGMLVGSFINEVDP